ncbi:MAG: ABC transporter ATP-binding protein [Saprospirales bacterium]|nr:MAG: ABC transporter ATP-binding protein [Saprospirales bacterium]
MNYLTFENVSRSYGDRVLFKDITLHINKGEKVALVAENGTGKTSLLRIITGEEPPEGDQARVFIHPGIKIGHLKQEPDLDGDLTVLEAVYNSQNAAVQALKKYEALMLAGSSDPDKIQQALEEVELRKGWDKESEIREILSKLKLEDEHQKVRTLSGGQKKRLSLAMLLIDEPDLFILDEPTNHLDLDMIEWLEQFLSKPEFTLFLITHDRYFLERICSVIVELSDQRLYKYQGNYSDFLEKKTVRETNQALRYERGNKLLKTELEWVRRQPKARGTKSKSRVQKFESLRSELSGKQQKDELNIAIKPERLGSKIMELRYIAKSFGERQLFKDFHYKFQKKDRVGVVGPNGSGKSTLLDMMAGLIPPDSGSVVHGETLKIGYFKQSGLNLPDDKRVIDYIREFAEYIPMEKGKKLSASQLLEQFLFAPEQQQTFISKLSGGEKRRLYLLSILIQNPNFLILDEPTNDLDILTLNVLEDYLMDFPGCVVIVSHDRFFMDKIVDHLFAFQTGGTIIDFPGNYTEYRSSLDQKVREERKKSAEKSTSLKKSAKPSTDGSGMSKDTKIQLRKLERNLQKLEKEKQSLLEKFDSDNPDPEKIGEWSKELKQVEDEIEELEGEWMELVD